jgi:hypothetical protein
VITHPPPRSETFPVPAGAPGIEKMRPDDRPVAKGGDDLAEARVSDLSERDVIVRQPPDLLRFEEQGRSR